MTISSLLRPEPGVMNVTIKVDEFVDIIVMHSIFPTCVGVKKTIMLNTFYYVTIFSQP